VQIHITDSGPLNGFYLWKGNEEQWNEYLDDVNGIVEIQNTGAFKATDPNSSNCGSSRWIYSPNESLAQGLYEVCAGAVYEFW
jgi:hypothetical protein